MATAIAYGTCGAYIYEYRCHCAGLRCQWRIASRHFNSRTTILPQQHSDRCVDSIKKHKLTIVKVFGLQCTTSQLC